MPHSAHADAEAYRRADDASLIERCRASGDEAAFAELVRRYQNPVFRLAMSILGQGFAPDAEDVAQEVMVRVYHALDSFRGDAAFGSWVYRIAFNHTLNVKARMRYRAPHVGDEALSAVPSGERSAHDQLQAAQRRRAIWSVLRNCRRSTSRVAPALLARRQHERNRDAARCAREHRHVIPASGPPPAASHAGGTRFPWLTTT